MPLGSGTAMGGLHERDRSAPRARRRPASTRFAGMLVAAVGPATAAALDARGSHPSWLACEHDAAGLAAAMLGSRRWRRDRCGSRSAEGRAATLASALRAGGATVTVQPIYRSVMPAWRTRAPARGLRGGHRRDHADEREHSAKPRRCLGAHAAFGRVDRLHRRADGGGGARCRASRRQQSREALGGGPGRRADRVSGPPAATLNGVMGFPLDRPRRLRRTPALRRLARETQLSAGPADPPGVRS